MNKLILALIACHAATDASAVVGDYELTYNPATGELRIEQGGYLWSYRIDGGPFFEQNHTPPLTPDDAPLVGVTSTDTMLGFGVYGGTPVSSHSLGNVLPAGLTRDQFAEAIEVAIYSPSDLPVFEFELVYLPEPSTLGLAGLLAVFLAGRRRPGSPI